MFYFANAKPFLPDRLDAKDLIFPQDFLFVGMDLEPDTVQMRINLFGSHDIGLDAAGGERPLVGQHKAIDGYFHSFALNAYPKINRNLPLTGGPRFFRKKEKMYFGSHSG